MDFKVEGPWNTEKYCRPPWLSGKKNFWILDALAWLKQWHFGHWWVLIVSALKLSFFPLFPFFLLLRKKVVVVVVVMGGGAWPPDPRCRQPFNIITEICKPLIWISNSELIYSLQKKNYFLSNYRKCLFLFIVNYYSYSYNDLAVEWRVKVWKIDLSVCTKVIK